MQDQDNSTRKPMIANNIVSATMEIKFKSHSTNFPIFTPNFFQHFYSICDTQKKAHDTRNVCMCERWACLYLCVFFVSLYFALSRYNFLFLIRMNGSVFLLCFAFSICVIRYVLLFFFHIYLFLVRVWYCFFRYIWKCVLRFENSVAIKQPS